jgi:hypothetical protein
MAVTVKKIVLWRMVYDALIFSSNQTTAHRAPISP